ncbi:hypothetical protein Xen7305DRAFT_00030590 [Xenococcus sp. PCC 7305]|uniref:hypothetical protein n=1 Tax=Xenococcus sp. PCC 7305 TaxID=102125 RepID=UPI0002AC5054|nr:hypothetical protein [Xenococcus sp. PCC 7305]ELS03337.1 hypothetical protein Xen7305DRAFT_00030590 [Xenococcus sp. PCC 7305]
MQQVINIIEQCQKEKFTGKLIFKTSVGIVWRFYFFSGQVFWINGGYNFQRFWVRNLSCYFPHIDTSKIRFRAHEKFECPYYQMLFVMSQRNLITSAESKMVIRNKMSDTFFDILQQSDNERLQISIESKSLKDLYKSGFRPHVMSVDFQKIQTKVQQEYRLLQVKQTTNLALHYSSVFLKS